VTIIKGSQGNDTLTVDSGTTSIQASAGIDTVIFSGNYDDYTFSQSDSYVSLMVNNTTKQIVSLFGVEQLQFDDGLFGMSIDTKGEFQVNSYTDGYQSKPSIAVLNNGGYVVVWQTVLAEDDIYAQRYDEYGNTDGNSFQVNSYTNSAETTSPHIATLSNDNFIVTWRGKTQNKSDFDIYARVYDKDGNALDSEFIVNTFTTKDQRQPNIVTLSDDSFIIIWTSEKHQDDGYYGIYAQRYDANGVVQGNEFKINTYDNYIPANKISASPLTDSGFVVVWDDLDNWFNTSVQIFNLDDSARGDEFQISPSYSEGGMEHPSVVTLTNGNFVVVWERQEYRDKDIYAQIFNANGEPQTNEFLVSLPDDIYTVIYQNHLSIAALINGGFVITWSSKSNNDYEESRDGGGYGILAKVFNSNGVAINDDFVVNTYTADVQYLPSVTYSMDGGFIITWVSQRGIYAQRYDAEGNPLGITILNAIVQAVGTMPDMVIHEGDKQSDHVIDPSSYFSDPDGNTLTYTITTARSDGSDSNTESIDDWNNSDWVIGQDGSEVGDWVYTITADDGNGSTTTQTFNVAVEPAIETDSWTDDAVVVSAVSVELSNTVTGTASDDQLTVQINTASVQGDSGTDTAVFSGNYADYTFSQSDSYVPLLTNNASGQVVSLFGVEQLQFDDGLFGFSTSGLGVFLVNTHTSNNQRYSDIASYNDGSFIVVWQSENQDGDGYGIFAQLYNANGSSTSSEFQVNTSILNNQYEPSIATNVDGNSLITWTSGAELSTDIIAQLLDNYGNTIGNEFIVNTHTDYWQTTSKVAALQNGDFVIVWDSVYQDGSAHSIHAQQYDAYANSIGSEFQVNTYAEHMQSVPSVAALSDGGYVVAWESYEQDGSQKGIYAQRFDENGNTVSSEFQINTYTNQDQGEPIITELNDGGFVVSWESHGQDGSYLGIFAQQYNANGDIVGSEIQINNYTNADQQNPSISYWTRL